MISLILIFTGSFFFIRQRLFTYLRFFQQHEYSARRFASWIVQRRAFDKKGSIIALVCALLCLISFGFAAFFGLICLFAASRNSNDPRKSGKITLKMTQRAERIFRAALGIVMGLDLLLIIIAPEISWLLQVAVYQSVPFSLVLANAILQRNEKLLQAGFVKEAKAILANCNPYTIGVTGSYGKTSTKDALGQILQVTLGPTFWPEKGVNSPMGITYEIRKKLQVGYKYAVVEMAAYARGSIKRLCDLTPPHAAIITCVGVAHLERFGSEENIYLAKSELAQAVPKDGILVCNGDDPGSRRMAREYPKRVTLLFGFDQDGSLDAWISDWSVSSQGTAFTLQWKGKTYQGLTPLLGKAALSNVLGSFTMACCLGSNPEYALAVIRNLEPVFNRLQIQKDGEIIYLRDAYNSNPVGFSAALDVLQKIPAKRRILMTPGFIELGRRQDEENERIAKMAATICDQAILVGETNHAALKRGLLSGGMTNEQLFFCSTRDQALEQLVSMKQAGDVILIENDLPDLYEATIEL